MLTFLGLLEPLGLREHNKELNCFLRGDYEALHEGCGATPSQHSTTC